MNDRDDVLAPYEAELASDPALQALAVKLSWQSRPADMSPDVPETEPGE